MTTIRLQTEIAAPIEQVFNLSRNIDFHMKSASQTKERAIAGRTSGLIKYGETVTWRGRHFGLNLKHTRKIVEFAFPKRFTDVMLEGHFRYFAHQHHFESTPQGTKMIDILTYRVPFGIFGRCFDRWILKRHLYQFLSHRNLAIKKYAENDRQTPHMAS